MFSYVCSLYDLALSCCSFGRKVTLFFRDMQEKSDFFAFFDSATHRRAQDRWRGISRGNPRALNQWRGQ